jgi:hypothetical protein
MRCLVKVSLLNKQHTIVALWPRSDAYIMTVEELTGHKMLGKKTVDP